MADRADQVFFFFFWSKEIKKLQPRSKRNLLGGKIFVRKASNKIKIQSYELPVNICFAWSETLVPRKELVGPEHNCYVAVWTIHCTQINLLCCFLTLYLAGAWPWGKLLRSQTWNENKLWCAAVIPYFYDKLKPRVPTKNWLILSRNFHWGDSVWYTSLLASKCNRFFFTYIYSRQTQIHNNWVRQERGTGTAHTAKSYKTFANTQIHVYCSQVFYHQNREKKNKRPHQQW